MGWNVKLVIGLALRCPMDRNRQLDRTERGQTILKEDAPDRGAERFKTDATVLSVVLDFAKLCGFGDAVIEHEAKRTVMWYAEHEHGRIVTSFFPHVGEKRPGQRNGIVGRVGNHVVAKRPPFAYEFSEYHYAKIDYLTGAVGLCFNDRPCVPVVNSLSVSGTILFRCNGTTKCSSVRHGVCRPALSSGR